MKKRHCLPLLISCLLSCGGKKDIVSNDSEISTQNEPSATTNQEIATKNEAQLGVINDTTIEYKAQKESEKSKEEEIAQSKINKSGHFSISYKLEIIEVKQECQECGRKKRDTYLKFPELDFSKYGNENEIKKLWEKHKKEVEDEIYGKGGSNIQFLSNLGSIVGGSCKVSRSKNHDWYSERESIFEKRTFKN
jgi:hypothetical protein